MMLMIYKVGRKFSSVWFITMKKSGMKMKRKELRKIKNVKRLKGEYSFLHCKINNCNEEYISI